MVEFRGRVVISPSQDSWTRTIVVDGGTTRRRVANVRRRGQVEEMNLSLKHLQKQILTLDLEMWHLLVMV